MALKEPNHECAIMVFRPTLEEFKDFSRYIHYMESQGAHRGGIAKVIPPKEWVAKRNYDNIDNFVIPAPISQVVTGQKGLFTQYNIQKKPMTVKDFRRLTNTSRFEPPFHESYEELERMYWKNITFNPPIYGADISGSLYDKDVDVWNVARLNTLLDVIEMDSGVKIEGVNTAYLYFGMWKTTFAWHTEDMDLYSINYVHFGAPKSWYAVPPEHGKRLERLAAGFFPNSKSNCGAFLRHKMTMISPNILRQYGIPVNKVTQEAGEFMITFPYGYHSGFNHGYNCAESTNFASKRWINYGRIAEKCVCRNDTVTIDMDVFVHIFQPEEYDNWKSKKHEVTRVNYNEIPAVPDMAQPYSSWRSIVEEYRKVYGVIDFAKKRANLPRKSPNKPKSNCSTATPTKSPQKVKVKSPKSCEKKSSHGSTSSSTTQLDNSNGNLCLDESLIMPQNSDNSDSKDDSASDTSASTSHDMDYSLIQEHQSVFDLVKSGARRMSSARALEFDTSHTKNSSKVKSHKKTPSGEDAIAAASMSDAKFQAQSGNKLKCTVKCEPLSNLPLEAVSQETYILKKNPKLLRKEFANQGMKRRHPVSKKSTPKKVCSKVLLQKEDTAENNPISKSPTTSSVPLSPDTRVSFKEEREYNGNVAKLEPYCSICSLFKPYYKAPLEEISTTRGLPSSVPTAPPGKPGAVQGDKTCPLIPEVSFASSVNHPSPLAVCQLLGHDGKSRLIQCCVCLLQVHASCYGVERVSKKTPWTCDRCMKREWNTQCTLCCFKGGALKRISGGQGWAHIVCAIAIPEVFFDNTPQRSNINVSKVTLSRLKLKCSYCKDNKFKQTSGVCLQCCAVKCAVSFHTTCAHAAGIPIEPGNWPFPVYIHCREHAMMKITGLEGEQGPPVKIGESVVAKHTSGKYHRGHVHQVTSQNFFKVNFKDNSWSDNLYQQDILDHDWEKEGFPEVGSSVQVRWTDGDLYEAEYRGYSVQQIVKVRFDDGTVNELERSHVFTQAEGIPQRIRRKMAKHPPSAVASTSAACPS
uniref:[histone H3]-trimethyl-L-lysine(9) demethylase n=1 Tax=Phallusia mammillata TaxID=59560 RepID=A0A6F9DFV9_9ASCI|nr:lysine-specific demethylase 4C [Phallusia mammillata]